MVDLTQGLASHYECTGTDNLIDSVGSDDFSEEGTVASVSDGKIGNARGPCSGNTGTGDGFSLAADGSGWDTSVSTASFTKGSFTGWYRLDGGAGDQEMVAQSRPADGNNRQFLLRGVWEGVGDTPDDDIASLIIYDHALDNGTFQIGAVTRGDQGAFPLGEWMFIGFSVNVTTETASMFLGIPSEGTYFDSRSMTGWDAFDTGVVGVTTIGIGSGASTEGIDGDIDHISWWNDRELTEEEFEFLYNGGNARPLSEYNTPLSAEFSASPTSGFAPQVVSFTDESEGIIDSYLWDFGDGDTSTEQNPVHIYEEVGVFTVSLTVTDDDGDDTETKVDFITIGTPAADFVANPTSGPAPLTVQFTDDSNFPTSSTIWDFGDPDSGSNNTSILDNPIHIYETPGLYTVILIASGGTIGPLIRTKIDFIEVEVPVPTAIFSATPVTGFLPLTVQFIDESTGFPDTFLWDFGDGTTSTEQNPQKTYTETGSFQVTLTITNVAGSDISAPQTIQVLPVPDLVADYITTRMIIDPDGSGGILVDFEDRSTEALGYSWDFDDGGTSMDQNPSHVFAGPGVFQVTLTVTHGPFTDTVCKNILVTLDILRFMEIWGTATFADGSPVEPNRVVQTSLTGIDSGTDCGGSGTDSFNEYKTVDDGGVTRYQVRARGNVLGISDSGFEDGELVFISIGGRTATTTLPNPGEIPVSVPFFQTLPSVPSSVIQLDLEFPLAATQAVPAGGTFNNRVEVTLTSNVTPSTIWYTIDGSDPTFSPTRVLFEDPFFIEEGTTTLKFFTEDPLGPDEVVQEEVYIVLPPTVIATPPASDYASPLFVTLIGNRSGTIYHRVNQQGGFIKFMDSIPVEAGTTGIQTTVIEAYLIDDLGKTAPTQTFIYTVDQTKPVITTYTLSNDDTVTSSQIISVQVEASSHTNTVIGLLLSTFSDFSDAIVQLYQPEVAFLLPAPDGTKEVFVRVSDQLGVFSETKSETIELDTEIPTFTVSDAPIDPIGESTILFSGTKSANSGIFLTINGGSEMLVVPFGSETTWEYEVALEEGLNTLEFQAGTAVGNRSTNIEERVVDVRLIPQGVTEASTITKPDGTWRIPFVFVDEKFGNLKERQHDFRLVVESNSIVPPIVTFPMENDIVTSNVITVTGTSVPGTVITLRVEPRAKVLI